MYTTFAVIWLLATAANLYNVHRRRGRYRQLEIVMTAISATISVSLILVSQWPRH